MSFKNSLAFLIASVLTTVLLIALPQDQEVFLDLENVEGTGDFTLGEPPNTIQFVGFTIETLEDPALLHSGTKAITLGPGQEGKIISQRGINTLEFYAAESTGGGKIEVRGEKNSEGGLAGGFPEVITVIGDNGEVVGLPANISPGANPALQSFVADSGIFLDATDLEFLEGIKEVRILNVTGIFSIDDLGYTPTDKPVNNTVYTRFESSDGFGVGDGALEPISIGTSPYTATFTSNGGNGGRIRASGGGPSNHSGNQSLIVQTEGGEFTITFETPVYEVDFYANCEPVRDQTAIDCTIEVFDTIDNLLVTVTDLETSVDPQFKPNFLTFNADELGAPGGIGKIVYIDDEDVNANFSTRNGIDDFGFTPIGAPGTGSEGPPLATAPTITTQPASQDVASGTSASLSVAASGDDLTYQWYTGNSGDTSSPVAGATSGTLDTGALTANTSFWVQITNAGGSANSDTAVVTVAAPSIPLVLDGSGDIAGEDIQHANGNVFDQILLTGESVQLQAKLGQITRVSFMDENEDIVQVEFSGNGTFTVSLDPATFLPPAVPPRYNQAVEYVTGKPSVVIDGADANTFFSIFTVGRINAFNQALFPEGQVYDAQADVALVEVVNSTGLGGVQLSNTAFSGSTGKVGFDARGVPIAVRLTVGDIDASGDAVPHLLFGTGSFTVAAGNPGLRITGGDLLQTNGASIVVAESGSTTTGFETLITQNNFKSDETPQPTLSIDATFANENGDPIDVVPEEITIE
jgi:hypothetical protein